MALFLHSMNTFEKEFTLRKFRQLSKRQQRLIALLASQSKLLNEPTAKSLTTTVLQEELALWQPCSDTLVPDGFEEDLQFNIRRRVAALLSVVSRHAVDRFARQFPQFIEQIAVRYLVDSLNPNGVRARVVEEVSGQVLWFIDCPVTSTQFRSLADMAMVLEGWVGSVYKPLVKTWTEAPRNQCFKVETSYDTWLRTFKPKRHTWTSDPALDCYKFHAGVSDPKRVAAMLSAGTLWRVDEVNNAPALISQNTVPDQTQWYVETTRSHFNVPVTVQLD